MSLTAPVHRSSGELAYRTELVAELVAWSLLRMSHVSSGLFSQLITCSVMQSVCC